MRLLILFLTYLLVLCACNNGNDVKAGSDSLNVKNTSDTAVPSGLDSGEVLYKTNCTSCHDIAKISVAPALVWEGKLMPKQWLRDYTRDNFAVKKRGDKYAIELSKHYGVMTQFDFLSDGQIDAIYRYIDTISKKLNLPEPLHMRKY